MQPRTAVRLLRHELRQAAGRLGAIQWPCTDTHPDGPGAPVRGRRLQHRGRLLRDVRPRPRDRRGGHARGIRGHGPEGTRDHQGRRVRAAARAARRGLPVPADHRAGDPPLPHAHQDRPGARAERRRARTRSWRSRTTDAPACWRSATATRSRCGLDGARWWCRHGWAAWSRACCSCHSTTATRGQTTEPTAANRLTITGWDPVSKQPHFKYAAVAVSRARTRRRHPPVRWRGCARAAGRVAGQWRAHRRQEADHDRRRPVRAPSRRSPATWGWPRSSSRSSGTRSSWSRSATSATTRSRRARRRLRSGPRTTSRGSSRCSSDTAARPMRGRRCSGRPCSAARGSARWASWRISRISRRWSRRSC